MPKSSNSFGRRAMLLAAMIVPLVCAEGDSDGQLLVAAPAPAIKAKSPIVAASGVKKLNHEELIELARTNPIELAQMGRQFHDDQIRDYSCVFVKQERIDNKLRPVEEIEVLFRTKPHSVFMKWLKNEDQVKRCLFIDTPDRVDSKGQKIAKVEPAGVLIRLIISEIEMPIHGDRARAASRRTIDEFGFRSTLDLLDRYNTIGAQKGVLDYHYAGKGVVDGRPTFIFERMLPYTGPKSEYPDAKMIIHLDQEWLLPTSVQSFADKEGKQLLGSYQYKSVRINPGLTDQHFKF
ncbi:MAG: DUF1571 domain-containing protein [Phycisphaerae bacterium]